MKTQHQANLACTRGKTRPPRIYKGRSDYPGESPPKEGLWALVGRGGPGGARGGGVQECEVNGIPDPPVAGHRPGAAAVPGGGEPREGVVCQPKKYSNFRVI